MQAMVQDVRYALRRMRRAPGFTAAAVATLALGLGLNSAVASLAHALFARPLALPEAQRLVLVDQTLRERPAQAMLSLSYPDYAYYREHAKSFSGLAAHYPTSPMQVAARGATFNVTGSVVTASYFDVLELRPALGRFFGPEEDHVPRRDAVAVISHDFWRGAFGRDAGAIGADVRVNGVPFRVIGVAPEGFRGIVRGVPASDVFIPSAMFHAGYRYCDGLARDCRVVNMVGRLRPQASQREAQAELSLLAGRLESAFPDTHRGRGVVVRPARGVRVEEQARNAPSVALLGAAAGLVLLAACANVAGLLLARGLARGREIAVRQALGASRGRLVRQLLVESLLLATAGGAVGLVLAVGATEVLRRFFGVGYTGTSLNLELSLQPGVVALGLAVAAATGVLTGLAPALQATRRDALPALKAESAGAGARRSLLRDALIACQVAASVVLLAGGALLVRSFDRLQRGPGFDPGSVVLLRLRPSLLGYGPERAWAFQREALRRLEALPGVSAASPATAPPLPRWRRAAQPVAVAGQAVDESSAFRAATTYVGPRYFATLGSRALEGREFEERDGPDTPRVALVNQTLARTLLPAGALGVRLATGGREYEVVGVVPDLQYRSAQERPAPALYLNYWQQDRRDSFSQDSVTHVRTEGNPAAAALEMRKTIAAIDPDVPVSDVLPLAQRLEYEFLEVRAARALLLAFGGLALVLSALGLYAALAFAVGQRSREIAVRMALGAARADVGALVLRQGLGVVGLGAALGATAAAAAAPLLGHLLYGVSPRDPLALLAGPAALGCVALLATWLPARRAMAVEPISALRAE